MAGVEALGRFADQLTRTIAEDLLEAPVARDDPPLPQVDDADQCVAQQGLHFGQQLAVALLHPLAFAEVGQQVGNDRRLTVATLDDEERVQRRHAATLQRLQFEFPVPLPVPDGCRQYALAQPLRVLRVAEAGQRVVAAGRLGGDVEHAAQRRVGVAEFAIRLQHGDSVAGVLRQPLEDRQPLALGALQSLAAHQVGKDGRFARLAAPEAKQQDGEQREQQQGGHADDQCARAPAGEELVPAGADDEVERIVLELVIAVDALDAVSLGGKLQAAARCSAAHLLPDGMFRRERPVDLVRDVRPADHQSLIVAAPEGNRPTLAEIDGTKDLLIAG
ncbi:MAG: hypothetical protein AW08_02720 [Candidatus Accumulibacter adjunctus]|uniref:Uncharacterized protein n=1 Tax=Candidatus Accumulibacter adjunctus TaxID=1454001 RepID=A0A011M9G7_9PROT|nr:MAG: hypothetical protein AW08_02720 [Candidatus Accumulibacter adjunctus]